MVGRRARRLDRHLDRHRPVNLDDIRPDPPCAGPPALHPADARPRVLSSGAAASPELATAAVLCWDGFLEPGSRDALFAHIRDDSGNYEPSRLYGRVDGGEIDEERRRSLVRREDPWAREAFLPALERPLQVARRYFAMEDVPFARIELQVTASGDGDFFTMHCDDGYGESYDRMLTFIYYLHREPRPFTGGTLNVFDSRKADGRYRPATSYARVDPRDNRLVMFPADRFHEVARTACPSPAFEDRRITVNGWYRAQEGFLQPPGGVPQPASG